MHCVGDAVSVGQVFNLTKLPIKSTDTGSNGVDVRVFGV